jgi:type I restriction enzyme S subunit
LIPEPPANWKKVKFKELAKQKSVRIDDPGESGYEKYVGLEHLDSGELVVKRYGSTSDVTSTMKLFEKDDILFARRNTYLRRVSVAPFDGVCSGDIIVLEPILNHIVKDFLPIFMQFEPFENRVISLSAGAFSKRIKWKQLAEEEIFIPPIEEQKKIVETIWSIQDNIEKNDELIRITEKLKRGMLNELLTKGIGHKKFKKTDLGPIPVEWDIIALNEILKINKSSIDPQQYSNKLFSYYTIPGYDNEKTIYREKGSEIKSLKYIVKNDSVLFSKLNPRINRVWKVVKDKENKQICSTEFIVYEPEKSIYFNQVDCKKNLSDCKQEQAIVTKEFHQKRH